MKLDKLIDLILHSLRQATRLQEKKDTPLNEQKDVSAQLNDEQTKSAAQVSRKKRLANIATICLPLFEEFVACVFSIQRTAYAL